MKNRSEKDAVLIDDKLQSKPEVIVAFLAWDEKYSVHIELIDAQHKKLFALLKNLFDEMGKDRTREALGVTIGELIQYAMEHFATEEKLLTQYNFPGYLDHKKEHEAFEVKVAAFQRDFKEGKTTLTLDVIKFLLSWLDHHILKVDKEYAPFLIDKGVC